MRGFLAVKKPGLLAVPATSPVSILGFSAKMVQVGMPFLATDFEFATVLMVKTVPHGTIPGHHNTGLAAL